MKHLKLFENKTQNIAMLSVTDMFDGFGFSSFQRAFFTRQDAKNVIDIWVKKIPDLKIFNEIDKYNL